MHYESSQHKGNGYGEARRICGACPVVEDCRKMADRAEREQPLSHLFGMLAGETPEDGAKRRAMAE
jgi:hypothetical protein